MEALIPVNYDGDRPTVSGRELHRELGVKTLYKDWFPRMCEYGFEEGRDFNPLKNEQVRQEGDRMVTRVIEDHQLTLNMAKEISMIQRNEAGKRIRLYLIQVEEAWNSPEQVMARALAIANRELAAFKATVCGLQEKTAAQVEKISALEDTVEEQDRMLKEFQPKAHYVDTILSSRTLSEPRRLRRITVSLPDSLTTSFMMLVFSTDVITNGFSTGNLPARVTSRAAPCTSLQSPGSRREPPSIPVGRKRAGC